MNKVYALLLRRMLRRCNSVSQNCCRMQGRYGVGGSFSMKLNQKLEKKAFADLYEAKEGAIEELFELGFDATKC